ncbi:serine/threonine-protein kinase [soil metagenome]
MSDRSNDSGSRDMRDSLQATPLDIDDTDPRVFAAVQEYMVELEAGRRPNRQEFLARFPQIRDDLSVCLQGLAFLNSAAAEIHADSSGPSHDQQRTFDAELASSKPLGDFKLLGEIGRGGMGVVYEAIQLSLGRRVAVKVLPLAGALDNRQLQRFRNEAQAAAQLHHTNIVPVYAVGCERSVHFYAMQLIDGQSLADVIRLLRSTVDRSAAPANERVESLSSLRTTKPAAYFRSVAQLAIQACEGLEYAHQLGVVHRDIKPANLLLDARGTLWVTDFGLAHVYADSGLTQTGDVLGTLRYMSPEQASGRAIVLDQRADIYSLGVTLYELLTLERAIPGESREELLNQISSVDPPAMRSISNTIPVDLETIVGKAISKDPAERYSTARALASDLQRFLSNEPIHARPPSVVDKAIKWTKRHKSIAVSAVAMLLLSSIGLLISTILIAREQNKSETAFRLQQQRAVEANNQRNRANASAKEARQVLSFLTRVATDELPRDPQFMTVRQKLLEAALDYYENFLDQSNNDPHVAAELTAARENVAAILAELTTFNEFRQHLDQVRLLSEPAVQKDLGMNDLQVADAGALADDFPDRPKRILNPATMSTDDRRSDLAQRLNQIRTSIRDILSPKQILRLRQIQRQLAGVRAFTYTDVIQSLNLTDEQKQVVSKLASLPHGRGGPDGGPGRGLGGPDGPHQGEHGERSRLREAGVVAQVVSQLNLDQQRVWTELCGEPFVGELSRDVFGPMGGRPGKPDHDDHDGRDDR